MVKIFLLIFILAVLFFIYYLLVAKAPEPKKITWGVTFSQMRAESLGIDWKKTYLAVLNELGVKNIKLHTQWNWIEGDKGYYYFDDVDWQISQAKAAGAELKIGRASCRERV